MKFTARIIVEIVLLALIPACVIASIIWMMFYGAPELGDSGWSGFRFFTVDSHALLGLTSIISLIAVILSTKKETEFPRWVAILQLVGVAGPTLTFFTVAVYLGPVLGYLLMLRGPNSLMHLITPVLGIVSITCFYEKNTIRFREVPLAVLPMVIYGIGYLLNIMANNGYGDTNYDWYGFGQWGPWAGLGLFFLMIGLTFGLATLLYLPIRKKRPKEND